jgi:probable HAF family extracellular repeat protein
MQTRNTLSTFAMLIVSAAVPAIAAAQTLPTYHVTELVPPSGATCAATAINDAGVAAGSCVPASAGANTYGATVWRNGVPTTYGVLSGGTYAQPTAINSLGTLVGDADANGSARPQAVLSTRSGLLNIDPINGGNARAIGVLDNGVVFGNMTKSLSGNTASWNVIMWTPDSGHPDRYKSTALPKLAGGDPKTTGVFALQANKAGQIVGWVTNTEIGQLGGFWNNDATHSVVALQPIPGGSHSIAWAVNDLGVAVGESNSPAAWDHAVMWMNDAAHTPVDLGALPGDTASMAQGVNNAGQVIGVSLSGPAPQFTGQRTFLYQNGVMEDLSALIDPADGFWTITAASAINNAGQIVATAKAGDGRIVPVVLTPAP